MSMSIGLGIGIGKRRDLRAGWSIGAASTDIDFANRRLAAYGRPRPFDPFLAYNAGSGFSRASAAYDQRLADPLTIDSYATDAARLRGDGLLIGPAATRLTINPQNPQAWSNNSATLTNLAVDGQWSPVRVASGGQNWHSILLSSITTVSGTSVSFRVRYKVGSSGLFRVVMYNSDAATTSTVEGGAGALAANSSAFGAMSNVKNTNLGGGLYEIEATFTPNASVSNVRMQMGPSTATTGQYVDIYGGQVTNTPYPREWILGTAGSTQAIAQDVLRWTPAQVGMRASEGFMFWRGTPLGFDPNLLGRLVALENASGSLGRVVIFVGVDGKLTVSMWDDSNNVVTTQTSAASAVGQRMIAGVTWGGGSCRTFISGQGSVADASAASPGGVASLSVGIRYDNQGQVLARHERVVLGNRRQSDAEFDATPVRLAA